MVAVRKMAAGGEREVGQDRPAREETKAVRERALTYGGAPLAYLVTFRIYGTWLHGEQAGSVDRDHNMPGTPMLSPDPGREAIERSLMDQPPYELDAPRREIVLATLQEVCRYRRWTLLAAHVRTEHVHAVVQAAAVPEKVLNDFKVYA